jgi:TRAP-type mannitol/chloroaromatic compound transport system permease large subunit
MWFAGDAFDGSLSSCEGYSRTNRGVPAETSCLDRLGLSFGQGLLILFMGGSIWIGIALFLVGTGGFFFYSDVSFGSIMSNVSWNNTNGSAMMALPFFIWMGAILFRSKISENLFRGLSPWMDAIPVSGT